LLRGANVKSGDLNDFGNEKEEKKEKKQDEDSFIEVDEEMFIKILSRDLTEDKKK
jgi:hypothetical protein